MRIDDLRKTPQTEWQRDHKDEVSRAAEQLASLPEPQFDEAAHPDPEKPDLEREIAVDPAVPDSDKTILVMQHVGDQPQVVGDVHREIPKFLALHHYIVTSVAVSTVESVLGRMSAAGIITDKNLWETDQKWDVAKAAHKKINDPVQLARYWRTICFLRGKTLGNVRSEATLAASMALLEVIQGLMGA